MLREIVEKLNLRRGHISSSDDEEDNDMEDTSMTKNPVLKIPPPPPNELSAIHLTNMPTSQLENNLLSNDNVKVHKIPPPVAPRKNKHIPSDMQNNIKSNPYRRLENIKQDIEPILDDMTLKLKTIENEIESFRVALQQIKSSLESN